MTTAYLHLAGNKLLISFDYNKYLVTQIKKIPGTRWNKNLSRWEAPLQAYSRLISTLDDVKISSAVMDRLKEEAELNLKVEELRKKEYHELEDYVPKVPLMSHQKKAFELHRILKGSANLSQMGAGKSASAICAIHWHIEVGNIENALVICPKSVIRGWEEQIEMFSDLSYISITGLKKSDRLERLNIKKDVYLINYDYTWRILDELLEKKFNLVIADEAHRIKNPQSNQSKACYAISDAAEYKIALTGTSVLNSSLDAFGFMRFIDSSVFGESFYSFRSKYFKNIGNENSPIPIFVPKHGTEKEISDKIFTRSLRWLKEECLDLPPVTHLPDRVIYLSLDQDKAYRNLQEQLATEIYDNKSIKLTHVLSLMLKLNQITSGWIKDSDTGEIIHFKQNPKFEELKEIVDEIEDEFIIIWAYYKEDMRLITDYYGRCTKCKLSVNFISDNTCPECKTPIKYRCSEVQGSTKRRNAEIARFRFSPKERAEMRNKFEKDGLKPQEIRNELGDLLSDGSEPPQSNIFVAQITAVSEGVNLYQSTASIYFSRNWSLKDYLQSLARNHRIGQTKKVSYINIVAKMMNGDDTVDQRIVNALNRKEDLSKRINKDDLKFLTGNFSKKDREDFKDLEIEVTNEEIVDLEKNDQNNGELF